MRCNEIVEKVGSYVDGELEGAARETVEAHLAACSRCADLAAEIREIDVRTSRLAVPAVAAEEWSAIWVRVQSGKPETRLMLFPLKTLKWALPLAAALVLGAIFTAPYFEGIPAPGVEEEQADVGVKAAKPERVSGEEPSSIDVMSVDEEDDTSYIRYADF
jgi:anti-sigma factor RsiW